MSSLYVPYPVHGAQSFTSPTADTAILRLLVYYPIMAVLVLFINLVTHRLTVVPTNDIAVMDIVTGMFGRLEFVTSGTIALSRIGEFARIARDYLEMDANFPTGDFSALDSGFASGELQDFDLTTLMDSTISGDMELAGRC
jgi:hypothetical protein